MKNYKPVVVEPLPVFEVCESSDAAERVRFHVAQAREHGRCAVAHIIEAGRELAIQKQLLGYGQWNAWCDKNLGIARCTADRYIEVFQRTVGEQRIAQGVAFNKKILKKELEAATVGMEEKTVRQAMIEIGVIKPNSDHGGAREGAGRKPKGDAEVAAEKAASEASIRAELSAEEGRDLVQKLAGWALGADDGFGALSDGELARVVKTLKQVLARAEEIQSAREDAR